MKKIFSFLILSFCIVSNAEASFTQASVNRNEIPWGESLMLTIETDTANPQKPDFEVLQKDFNIYSQGYVSNVSVVNGKHTATSGWQLILMPKQKGEIVIPAFTINGVSSQPITIKVGKADVKKADGTTNAYEIKATIDNYNPYPQQEIKYKLTLLDSGGLNIEWPEFEESEDWVIKPLKDAEVNPLVINGKKAREIVFNYAMFPQKSGKLNIPSASVHGYYLSRHKRSNDPFESLFRDDFGSLLIRNDNFFTSRTPINLVTEPIAVEVKAMPENNGQKWWLPAQKVIIGQEWIPDKKNIKVGEAITRNIYIQAEGVLDNQLPELSFQDIKGLKQYPEKQQREDRSNGKSMIATAKITNVYIPNQDGTITIPPIKVNWFNVISGKNETSELRGEILNIAPNSTSSEAEIEPATKENIISTKTDNNGQKNNENDAENGYKILILSIGAFMAGMVICYVIMRPKQSKHKQTDLYQEVIKAAQNKDLRLLRDVLIAWARNKYPHEKVNNFNDINNLVQNKNLAVELEKITSLLYSDINAEWDEKEFLRIFQEVNKHAKSGPKQINLLPNLYK